MKVDGERAYRRARRGEKVEPAEREVTVHRFEQLWREGERAELEIECSSGTYVRSLIADLGDAYCEALRRLSIGPFAVTDADPERLIALEDALTFLPAVSLAPEDARAVSHGRSVEGSADGVVRLLDEEGIVALAEPRDGQLKPIVGFRG